MTATMFIIVLASPVVFGAPSAAHEDGSEEYRWVNPPSGAPEAQAPAEAELEFALADESGGGTGDRQFLFRLPAGAIPASSEAKAFTVSVRPFDATDVARFPSGLVAASNAYQLDIRYRPGGADVGPLSLEGGFSMATAEDATELLVKRGDRWVRVADARPDPADHRMGGFFKGSVTIVAAAPGSSERGVGGAPVFAVIGITVVALGALAAIALSGRAVRSRS